MNLFQFTFYLIACVIVTMADEEEEETIIACEGEEAKLCCENDYIKITHANYGRNDGDHCINGPILERTCCLEHSQNIVEDWCNGKSYCVVPATFHLFGDPCPGTSKYLEVSYKCDGNLSTTTTGPTTVTRTPSPTSSTTNPSGTKVITLCELDYLNIQCGNKEDIKIIDVFYGRKSADICPNTISPHSQCDGSTRALKKIKKQCENDDSCSVKVTPFLLGNPCLLAKEYLTVTYICQSR